MDWHRWVAFVAATLVLGMIPGPGVTSIVGYALGSGRRTALASVAGLGLGNLVAVTLSLAGVGALLAASAWAFSVLKWAGAAYLIGLGVLTFLKAGAGGIPAETRVISARTAFFSNIAVGVFHPKTMVFFVAFVPQFVSAEAGYWGQAAILAATFTMVLLVTDSGYALAASGASGFLRRPGLVLWSGRTSGSVLVVAGLATAAARR